MMMNVHNLLSLQIHGGVLEDPSLNVDALGRDVDPSDADAAELVKLSTAVVLAKRELDEAVQRLSIKHRQT